MRYNDPMQATDGYKLGHGPMFRPGTSKVYSNLTPRSNKLFKGGPDYDGRLVVAGVTGFIREFLNEEFNVRFFSMDRDLVMDRYARRVNAYLGEGAISYDHIGALHDLGYLPIQIKSIDEGERIPMGVPILTITNTHPDFYWLVNYLETVISNSIWKVCTNATIAFEYRKNFEKFAKITGSPKELVKWQGHDFSARGMSGPEDAARSGVAHLMCFYGTDTVSAIEYAEEYYNWWHPVLAGSVPATEHSVATSNIIFNEADGMDKKEAEKQFMIRYLTEIVPKGIASYVADSFDYWGVLTQILPEIKDVIMARDGKLVIRPDSGDPIDIICGRTIITQEEIEKEGLTASEVGEYDLILNNGTYYEIELDYDSYDNYPYTFSLGKEVPAHEAKGSIEVLWEIFGGTITETGHKLLDSHIGLIYGDSITLERQRQILQRLADKGFASANVVLGIGSFTYNYSTRDTFGMAVKATYTEVDGKKIEIYKDPMTGKSKKSAKGLLRVEKENGTFVLYDQQTLEQEEQGELKLRFMDGTFHNVEFFDAIRSRIDKEFE